MSWPAFGSVVLAVLIVVAAGCWAIADAGRARRLATLIRAWRSTTAPPAAPATPTLVRQQRQATRKNA
jgi:hypothetical protein